MGAQLAVDDLGDQVPRCGEERLADVGALLRRRAFHAGRIAHSATAASTTDGTRIRGDARIASLVRDGALEAERRAASLPRQAHRA
jgi:hypothetical protein